MIIRQFLGAAATVILFIFVSPSMAAEITNTLLVSVAPSQTFTNGVCDVIAGGACAGAWSVDYKLVKAYTGKAFQLALVSNNSIVRDVGFNNDGSVAIAPALLGFCGRPANCLISKIYDQSGGGNTLVPGTPTGSSGLTGAVPLSIDPLTQLPTANGQSGGAGYYISTSDSPLSGFTGGTGANYSVWVHAYTNNVINNCCGMFGLAHLYNAGDTAWTDFSISLPFNYSTQDGYGCTAALACFNMDLEGGLVGWIDTGTVNQNVMAAATYQASGTLLQGWWNNIPTVPGMPAPENSGTRVHLLAGGDMSNPAYGNWREGIVTQTVLSQADIQAISANVQARSQFHNLFYNQGNDGANPTIASAGAVFNAGCGSGCANTITSTAAGVYVLVLTWQNSPGANSPSATDNKSDIYNLLVSNDSSGPRTDVLMAQVPAGVTSVTITNGAGVGIDSDILVVTPSVGNQPEIEALGANANGSGGSVTCSNPNTTTTPHDTLIGFVAGNAESTVTLPAGFTAFPAPLFGGPSFDGYKQLSAVTAPSGTFTATSATDSGCALFAIRP